MDRKRAARGIVGRVFRKAKFAILVTEARQLSGSQPDLALSKMLEAYAACDERPPSFRVPMEFNLSLAAMATSAGRNVLAARAIRVAKTQLPRDKTLNPSDSVYLTAYIQALERLLVGEVWGEILTEPSLLSASRERGVQRHLQLNFPFVGDPRGCPEDDGDVR